MLITINFGVQLSVDLLSTGCALAKMKLVIDDITLCFCNLKYKEKKDKMVTISF